MNTAEQAGWATHTASRFLDQFENRIAVDTADYAFCSMIIACAHLILADRQLAARVGELMEQPR